MDGGPVINTLKQCSGKSGFNVSAKSIDPGQPAQSAQADLGRFFLPFVYFTHVEGPLLLQIRYIVSLNEFYRSRIMRGIFRYIA